MNAQLLAELLLEMNLMNPDELKREVKQLGGHVADQRARNWFQRVVPFWMINIDRLLKTPYRAVAEPRSIRGGKYNFQPSGQWQEKPPEDTKTYRFRTGLEDKTPSTLHVKPEEWAKHASTSGAKTGAGIYRCTTCKGRGTVPVAGAQHAEACPTCHGSGRVRKEGEEASFTDPNLLYIEVQHDPHLYPRDHREGHFPESLWPAKRLAGWLLDEAEEPPITPDTEGVYTSMLHQPDIENQIKQSFTPFKPSAAKPKAKSMLGDPTPKEQVPPWASDDKELYHFNPIQTRRRELFQRLEALVNYLNFKQAQASKLLEKDAYATALATAQSEGEEPAQNFAKEQKDAQAARDYFRALETMKTDDIDGFRRVMREAEYFGREVSEMPWLFDKGAQVLATHGAYKITKVTSVPLAQQLSKRKLDPPYTGSYNTRTTPIWCTGDQRAEGYLNQGPLYFIDRNNQPYVLLHFESGQCKLPANDPINSKAAREIAPVVAKSREVTSQLLGDNAGGGELGTLASAVQRLGA